MSQPEPSLGVIGVYRVPFQEGELLNQLRRYYFFGNAASDLSSDVNRLIETCVPLALFELELDHLDGRFRLEDFTQEMPAAPRKCRQAPYLEALLSPDGSRVLTRKAFCTDGLRSGRVAFYFHYYDPAKPMEWSYGTFAPTSVNVVPRRIWDLLPYSPVD
jgi:hypothetical protein